MYICYPNTVLFRSEGLLLRFGLRKKFHASCDSLSQSNEAVLAENCQIWVIFKVYLHFHGNIQLNAVNHEPRLIEALLTSFFYISMRYF